MTNPCAQAMLADRIYHAMSICLMEQTEVPGPVWAMPLSNDERLLIVSVLRAASAPVAVRVEPSKIFEYLNVNHRGWAMDTPANTVWRISAAFNVTALATPEEASTAAGRR